MLFIAVVVLLTVALVELAKTIVTSFIDIPSWVWVVVTIAVAIGWSLVYSVLPAKVLDVAVAIAISTLFYDVIVRLVKGLVNRLNDW